MPLLLSSLCLYFSGFSPKLLNFFLFPSSFHGPRHYSRSGWISRANQKISKQTIAFTVGGILLFERWFANWNSLKRTLLGLLQWGLLKIHWTKTLFKWIFSSCRYLKMRVDEWTVGEFFFSLNSFIWYSFSGEHENWRNSHPEEACATKKSQTGLGSRPHSSLFQIKFTFFFFLPF